MSLDATDLATLSRLRASGVPVIVVLVSDRPLDVAAEVGNWYALLAAWLPGSESAGVADVLFGDYAPTGKLPVTWMRSAERHRDRQRLDLHVRGPRFAAPGHEDQRPGHRYGHPARVLQRTLGPRLRDVVKTPDGTGLWLSSSDNDMPGGSPNTLHNVIVRLTFAG